MYAWPSHGATAVRMFERMLDDPSPYSVIAATTYDHDGEKAREWFGIGNLDFTDCRSGKDLND